jgi:hypothetical protein
MIKRVRDWIFTKGRNIASSVIDKVLGPMSLVPTRVSFITYHVKSLTHQAIEECFFGALVPLWI